MKTYSRFREDKEKGIKAYHYGKSSVHKGRQQKRKKGTWEKQNSQKTMSKMALASPHPSTIILNANELNSLTQRHKVGGWIKTRPNYKRLTSALRIHIGSKWRDGKRYSMGSYPYIRQIDFKPKTLTRDKDNHYIISGSVHQEDTMIINIYAPNIRAS